MVAPPPPVMPRGRVCTLTFSTDINPTTPRPASRAGGDSTPSPKSPAAKSTAADGLHPDQPRHLVAVLETGAVFVVLLERKRPACSTAISGGVPDESGGEGAEARDGGDAGGGGSTSGDGKRDRQPWEYNRLGAGQVDQAEFAPVWLDVGRGGGGGGGGGMGVRAVPSAGLVGSGGSGADGGDARARLRMSVVSRAWGNKCAVKMLRLIAAPEPAGGADKGTPQEKIRGRGGAKQPALRTETMKQLTLPVDHPSPEQHGLAVVDGSWALLASPPTGGAPARVTVAPLDRSERSAASQVRVFPLPVGEHVGGVALASRGHADSVEQSPLPTEVAEKQPEEVSWGIVWSDFSIYRVDFRGDGRAPPKIAGAGRPTPPKPPAVPPEPHSTLKSTPPGRRVQSLAGATAVGGVATASIAVRRPAAASVRRARELYAAGLLTEAAQVAMEALDVGRSSAATARGAKAGLSGQEDATSGGGVTTRMVREDLANSLLEWLITIHVRRSSSSPAMVAAQEGPGTSDYSSTNSPSSGTRIPGGATGARKNVVRPTGGSTGRNAHPGAKKAPSARISPTSGPERHETEASSTATGTPPYKSGPAAIMPSKLERYLLASVDYDPLLAAKLLHTHGEADLAAAAGAARGGAALAGVLRVLAESAWPPRLGPRAVDALCACEDGARELVLVGRGSLFATLGPYLQARVLLSDRRVLFGTRIEADGSTAVGDSAKAAPAVGKEAGVGEEVDPAATTAVVGAEVPKAGEAIAGIRSHLGPIVSALSAEDIGGLISRLAQWCREETVTHSPEHLEGRVDGLPNHRDSVLRASERTPSVEALEAMEVLLEALCELSGRKPPFDDERRRAWLHAGCIDESDEGASDLNNPPVARKKSTFAGACSAQPEDAATGNPDGISPPPAIKRYGACWEPRLRWSQMTKALCGVLEAKGIGASERDGRMLPTAARRALLRALPVVRGWHDPMRVLMRSRGFGCWAAVALELELSGNEREATSAMLHGVVTLLKASCVCAVGLRWLFGQVLGRGGGSARAERFALVPVVGWVGYMAALPHIFRPVFVLC